MEELRVRFLGKKAELTAILKQMGKLSPEERPVVGALANRSPRGDHGGHCGPDQNWSRRRWLRLAQEEIGVTLPGKRPVQGKRHPFEQVLGELKEIFFGHGF